MGTEIFCGTEHHINFQSFSVKLNNPQMGTEILKPPCERNTMWWHVKLNNPQMGTEI